jgi:hypothetical protein
VLGVRGEAGMTDIASLSSDKLARHLADLEAEIAILGAERKTFLAEIGRRFSDEIKAHYKEAGKEHGKITVPSHALRPFALEVETRQTVTWDQDKLNAAASDGELMSPEEAQHLIKVELSVAEKTYNALPPGPIKTALKAARTTKLSAPSIKVVFPKDE